MGKGWEKGRIWVKHTTVIPTNVYKAYNISINFSRVLFSHILSFDTIEIFLGCAPHSSVLTYLDILQYHQVNFSSQISVAGFSTALQLLHIEEIPPPSLTPLASNQSVLYSPFLHHHWSNYLVLSIISGQHYAYVALCQFAWIPCTVDFNRHLKTKCFFSPLVPHSLQFSWYLCTLFAAVLVFLDSIILKFLLASQNLPLLFWPFLHFCSSIAPTSSPLHFQVTAPHTVCCLVSVSLDSIYH